MDKGKMKFYYFPLNARGGTIRAILSAMNANWENSVVSFENLPTLKNGNFVSSSSFQFWNMEQRS